MTPAADAVEAGESQLIVHHRHGVERIRLTGDPRLDAALRRFAEKGGFVTTEQPSESE